jgi:serine O-acetyltransferase
VQQFLRDNPFPAESKKGKTFSRFDAKRFGQQPLLMADMDYRLKDNDGGCVQPGWDLQQIVGQLRNLRSGWRQSTKPDGVTYELPSQDVLSDILEGVTAALFPRHFGPAGLTEEAVDSFIADTLDEALHSLREQIRRELRLALYLAGKDAAQLDAKAREITRAFAEKLPKVRGLLETDILAAYQGDPAARNIDEVLFCYPGIVAIARHRLAHELYLLGAPLLARIISEIAHSATGIDIHPGARIGDSFFIDHGTGVVIGETAVIGKHVRLYQGVTLGAKRFAVDENGALLKGGNRHPIIEDDVVIYAGATILGRITIGRGSSIGGNVWLTRSVPPGSNITQAQARNDVFVDGGGI